MANRRSFIPARPLQTSHSAALLPNSGPKASGRVGGDSGSRQPKPAPGNSGRTRFEACLKLSGKSRQVPKRDRFPNPPHDVKVKVQVVVRVQARAENFIRQKKMPQIRARIAPADRTAAA